MHPRIADRRTAVKRGRTEQIDALVGAVLVDLQLLCVRLHEASGNADYERLRADLAAWEDALEDPAASETRRDATRAVILDILDTWRESTGRLAVALDARSRLHERNSLVPDQFE